MTELNWDRQTALDRTFGEAELLAELMDLLLESARENRQTIVEALEQGQAEPVMRAGHSLKGAAANMAAEGLRETAFQIEQAGRENDLDTARRVLPQLDDLIGQLADLLPLK